MVKSLQFQFEFVLFTLFQMIEGCTIVTTSDVYVCIYKFGIFAITRLTIKLPT